MKSLAIFFETATGKQVKNMIIGVGAAVVMMGALFKLQHWPGASVMLIAGLSTEAFIFFLQGILPPHKDYYWEKLYPDLDISPEVEHKLIKRGKMKAKDYALNDPKSSITEKLDEMLEEANLERDMLNRLGDNLKKLGDNIEGLQDVTSAASATSEYSESAKQAAAALAGVKSAYTEAAEAMSTLSNASSDTQAYHEQVQVVTKNLAQLNAIYELELQDTNTHLKTMNKFYKGLEDAMNNLSDSVTDAETYKNQMAVLASNLTTLNNVYGNMLSAMGTAAPSTAPAGNGQ